MKMVFNIIYCNVFVLISFLKMNRFFVDLFLIYQKILNIQ